MHMSINPYDARDIAWREATRAVERRPHRPTQMTSLQSTGPLKDYICPACSITAYSTQSSGPVCYGGYRER